VCEGEELINGQRQIYSDEITEVIDVQHSNNQFIYLFFILCV